MLTVEVVVTLVGVPVATAVVCIEPVERLELDELVLPRLLDVVELVTVAVVLVPLDPLPLRSRLPRVLATGLVVFVVVVLPEDEVSAESATSIELDVEPMELELVELLCVRVEEEDEPTELELVEVLVRLPEEDEPTELELVEVLVRLPEEDERSDEERLEDDEKLEEDDDETSPPSDSIEIESTPPVSTSPNSALSRFTSTSTSVGVSVRDVSGVGSMLDKLPFPDGSVVTSEFGSVPCKSVARSPSSVLSSRTSSRAESPPSIDS